MGKEVRICTSFSDSSDGSGRVRSLVPLFITLWILQTNTISNYEAASILLLKVAFSLDITSWEFRKS